MDCDENADSKKIQTNNVTEEFKTEPSENTPSTPNFAPPQKSPNTNEDVINSASVQSNVNEKNGQKRNKTEPDNGTCKKPRKSPPEVPSNIITTEISYELDDSSDSDRYCLTVSNLPNDWDYVQIKHYLDKECGCVDEMEMLKQNNLYCAIRLTFQAADKCKEAFERLKHKVIQENTLDVVMTEPITKYPPGNISPPVAKQVVGASESTEVITPRPWRPDQDMWETDPQGLYGLSPHFLKSLNITPPIDRWVHVTNLACDKAQLNEVMELAGKVLMCNVVLKVKRYAKVMYSHPLEAVQAVSMLNGRMYYGIPLKVTIDRIPTDTVVLPRGLSDVGLGLGLQGRPIRDVAQQYIRYATNRSSSINPIFFSKINISDDNNTNISKSEEKDRNEIQRKIDELMNSTQNSHMPNQRPFKVTNIDELDYYETNSKDGSSRSTPDSNITKPGLGRSGNSSIASLSPNRDTAVKNGPQDQRKTINKPIIRRQSPMQTVSVAGGSSSIRLNQQGPRNFPRPGLLQTPPAPMFNPLPIAAPGQPNYRPDLANFANQPRPGQFGPRPVPFRPAQNPSFGPQPMPAAFGPRPSASPQMSPTIFSGPRPFVGPNSPAPGSPNVAGPRGPNPAGPRGPSPVGPRGPNPAGPRGPNAAGLGPNINPANRVVVHFANLPPSTTFPLLCDKLAQCGQVMSVQLTTPGCAVATFGHPSHAERCFQTFNGTNIEGYIIDAKLV